jgi:hypothetical protein
MSPDLVLERSSGSVPVTDLARVNAAMAELDTRLWPLDLRAAPAEIRRLIAQPTLDESEAERLKAYFLLPRQRLLDLIEAAGRTPHVSGGGELSTYVTSHDYRYPQLWVVEAGVDYTRFDRFHVNRSEDGTGVDEVFQMLWGRGLEIVRRKPDGEILTLTVNCPGPERGWLGTYSGKEPHMGRVSSAEPGTKLVVQAIGPPRWSIRYESE